MLRKSKEEHYKEIAFQTRRCYEAGYNDLIDRFGTRYAMEITQSDLRQWIDELKRKGFASKTVRNRLSVAKIIYRYLCSGAYGNIDYDPTQHVEVPRGLPKSRRQTADTEDIQKILQHTEEPAGRLMAFLLLIPVCAWVKPGRSQGKDIDRIAKRFWCENRLLRK